MKKYNISPIMLMLMAAFIIIDGTMFAFYAVISALAHELAHIITLRVLGGKVNSLNSNELGISLKTGLVSYKTEALTALAGPAASLFLFLLFFVISRWFVFSKEMVFLAASNLALFLVNALPIYPLDGGRAVFCILSMHTDKSRLVTKILSLIFLLPLCVISVIILINTGYNMSLLLICVYLSVCLLGVKDI